MRRQNPRSVRQVANMITVKCRRMKLQRITLITGWLRSALGLTELLGEWTPAQESEPSGKKCGPWYPQRGHCLNFEKKAKYNSLSLVWLTLAQCAKWSFVLFYRGKIWHTYFNLVCNLNFAVIHYKNFIWNILKYWTGSPWLHRAFNCGH